MLAPSYIRGPQQDEYSDLFNIFIALCFLVGLISLEILWIDGGFLCWIRKCLSYTDVYISFWNNFNQLRIINCRFVRGINIVCIRYKTQELYRHRHLFPFMNRAIGLKTMEQYKLSTKQNYLKYKLKLLECFQYFTFDLLSLFCHVCNKSAV